MTEPSGQRPGNRVEEPNLDEVQPVQGVIKSYDPGSGDGVILTDTDLAEYDIAAGALVGTVFRMLRQGQRVVFDLDDDGRASALRLGSEVDMATPHFPQDDVPLHTGI